MEGTKASGGTRWYPGEDNAQTLDWSSAPFGHSFASSGEHSSPHQYRPSYTSPATPHAAHLPSNSFPDPGPSLTSSNFDPPSQSSLSFHMDLQALQSIPGPRDPLDSYSYVNQLPNPAYYHNHQDNYQPTALQHPTQLDECPPLAIRSGASPDLHPNNPSTLVSRQLPLRQFQLEQDGPQYPAIQHPTTSRRPRSTNSFNSEHSTGLSNPHTHPLSASSFGQVNQGILQGAHNFTMHGVVMNEYSNPETFMLTLLAETIHDVAFNSARRYPPPCCLQGTRQATIDRTWSFIDNHSRPKRVRCIIGPAGAGKSAVMQTLAEAASDKAILGASIFFDDGRDDISKAITTLAYQFAVNYGPYRPFIRDLLMHDPSLPQQSLVVQFRKLIVEPFVHQQISRTTGSCILVLLDGLDRCDEDEVCEFLKLITEFAIDHPTSPLTWVISCRAEPHIMMFLGRMKETYEEEVLEVDEEDACRDVKHFLRYQLDAIKQTSLTLRRYRQWPEECDITKIAEASKGFFAYANSVVKFVKGTKDRSHRSRLSQVLQFISGHSISPVDRLEVLSHPMSTLDTLYGEIMAKIPYDVNVHTQHLLLRMMNRPDDLHFMCNWLCMTEETAYNATYPLHSVLRIPEPEDASSLGLRCFHPSFIDYLRDNRRSAMFFDIQQSTSQLDAACIHQLLSQTINGSLGSVGPALLDIPLSWPMERHSRVGSISKDEEVKVKILQRAAETTVLRLVENAFEFQDPFYARALIAFDNDHLEEDPDTFRRLLFADSRRPEFIKLGVLKEMPLRMLDLADIDPRWLITCRFKCCAATKAKKPCSCGPSCPADWEECVEDGYVSRTASFFFNICSCSDRFIRQLEIRKAQSPEQLITIFLNLKRSGWIEYRFTDPDNGGSEWTYYLYYTFPSATYPFSAGTLTSQRSPHSRTASFFSHYSRIASFFSPHRASYGLASLVLDIPSPIDSALLSERCSPFISPLDDSPVDSCSFWSTSVASQFFIGDSKLYEYSISPPIATTIATKHDFMALLLQETISGNSLHSPSPCHRGTRSTILYRVHCFITNPQRTKGPCWLIGMAGCGKTTIMHTIEENLPDGVSVCIPIFLSSRAVSGTDIIKTIAYQLALHNEPYKQFIKDEVMLDPSLLHKSLATQFHQLIVKPFVHQLPCSLEDGCILILLDGLDQYLYDEETPRTLITLICDFCVRYPVSSLVWVISSRPETHIITIFNDVEGAYEIEEIDVNGTEACEDVQRFLRYELNQIANRPLGAECSQWPSEYDLMKIAGASRGFFAYAASIINFIKFPTGDPDSRLQQVLEFIDSGSISGDRFENQPMSSLNRLYSSIASKIPARTVKDTWPWLLRVIECSDSLRFICNWLGVTEEEVYCAADFLRSVLRVPEPEQADSQGLECVHPSFIDHIRSYWQQEWGSDIHDSIARFDGSCVRRILEEAPNGTSKVTSGTVANIRLSWPEGFDSDDGLVPGDEELKFRMYKSAAKTTVSRMAENDPEFEGPSYVRALTAFENEYLEDELHVFARLLFDESRHSKFMECGVLKEMSIKMISATGIDERWPIRCQYKSSASEGPHPCGSFCEVNWVKNDEKNEVLWTAANLIFGRCDCSKRFLHQLEYEKANCTDRLLRVFINLHRTGFVEYQIVEDGKSEWIYYIPYSFLSMG